MFIFRHLFKKSILSWIKICAKDECFAIEHGFGRLEKARCLGRLEAYENVLRWMGIREMEIETMRRAVKIN